MLSSSQLETALKALKPILYRDFSVTKLGLFGSFADNTFTEDSDIDLLVEFEKPIGWNFFSLEIYLEQMFGRKIDIVTQQALKEQIKDSILGKVKYL
jgi:predicted nucleotidyltransferase